MKNANESRPIQALLNDSIRSDQPSKVDPGTHIMSSAGTSDPKLVSESQCVPTGSGPDTLIEEDISWSPPMITSLYPDTVLAGSGICTLTIDGNNFIPESRVLWDARDYTKEYLSIYQMTAVIPAEELGTPGQHYIWVYNPSPCGGDSNIATFQIRESGQSFPLTTNPLTLHILKGQAGQAGIQVQSLPKGLLRYNLTLLKDSLSPFSFFFSGFPSWVSDPQVTRTDNDRLLIKGGDINDRIRNETGGVSLVNISIFGSVTGSGRIQCILNEATADDGSRYGTGYTALPVVVGEITPFTNSAGGMLPPPTDPDGDGLYEDINGNGRLDLNDIVIFFDNSEFVMNYEPWWPFDFDKNEVINLNDIVGLFKMTII